MLFLPLSVFQLFSPRLSCAALGAAQHRATRGLRRAAGTGGRDVQPEIDDELLPKVALVGRPNVGKSALFNRLLRRRAALVYDTPTSHVTRDYQEGRAQLGDLVFRAADTSGLEPRGGSSRGSINARATAITAALLKQCHLALLVLDAKVGVCPADEEVAQWLLRHVPRDQVLVVANKAEGAKARDEMPQTVYDCYRLGFGEPIAVSASTGDGLADLYTALQPHVDALTEQLAHAKATTAAAEEEAAEARGRGTGRERRSGGRGEEGSSASAPTTTEGAASAAQEAESPRIRMSLLHRQRRRRPLFGGGDGGAVTVAAEEGTSGVGAREGAGDGDGGGGGGDGEPGGVLKLAIMGLPNAGKSTLLNRLVGEERSLTGPEPGLTRDAVRAAWTYGKQPVELIDTAGWIGVGRPGSYDDVGGEVALMSRQATLRALAQVHVALLLVDAERALRSNRVLAKRELSLASHVIREGKALVLVANKVDALSRQQRALYSKSLRQHLSERFLEAGQLPLVEVSAREGSGVEGVMPLVAEAYEAWNKRVGTARLNALVAKLSARMAGGGGTESSLARIRYLTQIKTRPPTFVAFLKGTRSKPVSGAFSAFLAGQIREVLGFPGVPLRIWFRYRDRLAERKRRLVDIRSRAGQVAARGGAAGSAAAAAAAAAGSEEAEAEEEDPRGSIMADALRRAAELRRDVDDGEEEQEKEEGQLKEAAVRGGVGGVGRARARGGRTPLEGSVSGRPAAELESRDAVGDVQEEDVGMGVEGRGGGGGSVRYRPPRMLRRQGAAAAAAQASEAEAEAEVEASRSGRSGDNLGAMDGGEQPASAAPSSRGRSSGSSRSRAARLQRLDEDDEDDEREGGEEGWRWEDAAPQPAGRQHPVAHTHTHTRVNAETRHPRGVGPWGGPTADGAPTEPEEKRTTGTGAMMSGAATAAAMAAAAALRSRATASGSATGAGTAATRASGKGGNVAAAGKVARGSAGGGGAVQAPTRAALVRAMLFSRKPSAPLVPVQAPRRSRKQRSGGSGAR
ncbi:hypothetical protein PLESTB_000487100 [Pleodorina starrii]|uniref:GTPase Der n=1 Tax=Pleodorina starrii TaxID=330485 RepID=A0A9W6BFI6_9CHLO|nr:hypothetical protein PLESTM_000358300 [Pleodorina starrii]GLC51296.1 hypothetical protein PLESTB_000487100 [Pleodorina starrii]GLC63656.1 hypothetical protein PLESTF_000060000 [Pleodorina starrii]